MFLNWIVFPFIRNVPEELRKKYPQGLYVGLEDRRWIIKTIQFYKNILIKKYDREENYKPPTPPKYIAFSGASISLSDSGAKSSVALGVNVKDAMNIIVN